MTLGFRTVLFSPLVPDGSGAENVATGIQYRWRAVKPWDAGSGAGGMETQWSPPLLINGTAVTRDLPITPDGNGLDVEIKILAGRGQTDTRTETVAIPVGTGTIDFYNTVPAEGTVLVRLDRASLTAIPTPPSNTVQAQLDALTAAVAAISGGASNLGAISDMSPFMRTVNDDTTAAAARTTLGAGTSSLVVGTTSGTAADGALAAPKANPTFTGTVTVPTPVVPGAATTKAYVDSQVTSGAPDAASGTKGLVQLTNHLGGTATAPTVPGLATLQAQITGLTAPDWGAVANKPNVAVLDGSNQLPLANLPIYAVVRIGNGGSTVPVRPAYPGPIDFWCSTEPPRTGNTAGGTAAAAPGDSWLQASA